MQPDGQHMASGRQLDISLTVHRAAEAVFSLDVAASETYCTRVTYSAPEGKLVLDRSRAGMPGCCCNCFSLARAEEACRLLG